MRDDRSDFYGTVTEVFQLDDAIAVGLARPGSVTDDLHPAFLQYRTIICPPTYVYKLRACRLVHHRGIVVSHDGHFVPGLNETSREDGELLRPLRFVDRFRAMDCDGPVAAVTSRWSHNYFHYLLNVFVKFELIARVTQDPRYFFSPNEYPFQKECISAADIDPNKLVPARAESHVKLEEGFIASIPGISGCIRKSSIEFVRKHFLGTTENKPGKRLYVTRADAQSRKLVNEDQVSAFLEDEGFDIVNLQGLPIKKQAELFNNVDLVVVPHGAALTNLVFCRPDAVVVELFGDRYVNTCYWELSNQIGLKYYYILGHSVFPKDDYRVEDLDYSVDLEDLRRVLDLVASNG